MKNLIYLSLLTFLFACCKGTKVQKPTQYPEDPGPSTLTAIERLVNKKWLLKSVTLNGTEFIDSVHLKNGSVSLEFQNVKVNALYAPSTALKGQITTDTFGAEFVAWEIGDASIWSSLITPNGGIGGAWLHHFISVPNCFFGLPNLYTSRIFVRKLTTTEFKVATTNPNGDSTIINYFQSQ